MEYIKKLIKKYRIKSFSLVIAVTICNVFSLLYNYSYKFVIDSVQQKNITNAWKYFFVVLAFQILVTVFTLLIYDYYLRIFQKSVERKARNDIMSEILTWPYSSSKDITAGNLSTLMSSDVTQIGEYVSLYHFMIYANTIRFFITYFMLYSLDGFISVIVLLSVPLYYFCTKFTMDPMQRFVKEGYEAKDELNNSLLDILNNIMDIKAYSIENKSREIIENNTETLYIKEKNHQKWKAIFLFVRNFLTSFTPVVILGISIIRIIKGDMTIGTLVAIYNLLDAIYLPVSELFYFKAMKNNLEPVIDRINPIIKNSINKDDKRIIDFGDLAISVDNLSYTYGENKVIHNLSFKIDGVGLYRLCGDNGKGKTTFFNILSGLYNDFNGTVKITLDEKVQSIAYMNQKNILYDANIEDNISLFGKNKISELSIKLLDKFKNRTHEKSDFSGGEKRLFLFLRTIESKASIYLFDEPFEGVDQNTKAYMKEKIMDLSKNNLVLIISHGDKDFEALNYKSICL